MVRLQRSDLERLSRFAAELADADESEPFPPRVVESFRVLVGSESATYCELDRIGRRVLMLVDATGADDEADDLFECTGGFATSTRRVCTRIGPETSPRTGSPTS